MWLTRRSANTQSGALGVTGMVGLMLVAILLLSSIETTFNDIWGVTRGRSWAARVVQYWATITLGPIVLLLVLGLTTSGHFVVVRQWIERVPVLGSLLFSILPFVILIGAFAAFYGFMPNTKVQWRAALVGGLVGGGLWQLNNVFNVIYVSKVVSNSKIYGSLSVVPIFLIGMYFSWMIMLFGAQVAYAFQNRSAYWQAKLAENVNQRGREFVGLRLATKVALAFQRGVPAPSAIALAAQLGVPSRLAAQILHTLVSAKLLQEVAGAEIGYTTARPLNQITCQDILQALRASQGQEPATREEPTRTLVREEFNRIRLAEHEAASAATLQTMVDRVQAAPERPS
jgi:membrane protein